mgnify:FL=1
MEAEGVTPRHVIEKLKLTLDKGAGVKATASDSVAAAKVLLKTMEKLDDNYRGGMLGLTINVTDLSRSELIESRRRLQARWTEILEG